jgi:elongation factor 1-beta
MAQAIVQIKIMPESPSVNLDTIEKSAEALILKGTKQIKKEREPIAFGLVAIKILFTWDEASSTDDLLDQIRSIKDVSSAEIIDFRRAIG